MDANSDRGSIRICYHLSGERGKILFLKWNLSPFLCLIIPTNYSWITGYGGMSCVYWFRLIKIYLWNWEWCQLSLYLVAVEDTDTWKKKKMIVLEMKKLRNGSRVYYTPLTNWVPWLLNKWTQPWYLVCSAGAERPQVNPSPIMHSTATTAQW